MYEAHEAVTRSEMKRALSVMRWRVKMRGMPGVKVHRSGAASIEVDYPWFLRSVIGNSFLGSNGTLGIYDLETGLATPSLTKSGAPMPGDLYSLLRGVAGIARRVTPRSGHAAHGSRARAARLLRFPARAT